MNPYRSIFRLPGALPMTSAALVGRMPMAMTGLAVTLLVVGETDRYAVAGAVAGMITLATAVGGPVGAGLADRYGQHRVLPPLVIGGSTALALLTVAVLAGTPLWTWIALAALAGLASPNLGAMIRARWAHVARDPAQLGTAFALESTLDEVAFVVGPPLATALAVVIAPWSAIAAGILMALGGGLALAVQRATEPHATPASSHAGPPVWRSSTLCLLTLVMLLMGGIFGALEVATVAYAQEKQVVPATGVMLALFALGSGATGVVLGLKPGRWRLSRQLLLGITVLAATSSLLPFLRDPRIYAIGMLAAGLGVSAVLIGSFQVIERALPRARLTAGLAMATAGISIGVAGAVALAGARIDAAGAAHGMAVGSVAALSGAIVIVASRKHLARLDVPDAELAHV
jgi:MFS family permease